MKKSVKKSRCCEEMMGKYAEAILSCLRIHEADSIMSVKNQNIVVWVQNALGIPQKERDIVTKGGSTLSSRRMIEWGVQLLRRMKLIEQAKKYGHWKLTKKAKNSQLLHKDYIKAYRKFQMEDQLRATIEKEFKKKYQIL